MTEKNPPQAVAVSPHAIYRERGEKAPVMDAGDEWPSLLDEGEREQETVN